ncbi:MAG: hypothetical protein HYY16_12175 [Planctomycetes bacterium]|nr:hypothetical protein [Planctomycetota bacterium]
MRNNVETARTDLATLLSELVSRLRNDGLALTGLAWRESHPGSADHEDLHGLAGSLERTAKVVEAIRDRLCATCRMVDVAERVTFGKVPEVVQEPKAKGERTHGQEEEQERWQGSR